MKKGGTLLKGGAETPLQTMAYRIYKYILVRFLSKSSNICQILVRVLGKIGQIVGQILENFSQILMISILLIFCLCNIYNALVIG